MNGRKNSLQTVFQVTRTILCIPCGKNVFCEKQGRGDVVHLVTLQNLTRFITKMFELKLLALEFRSLRTHRLRKEI